ncbi:PREDICTED: uncharacterized protein LOC106110096 [Papilio polytes]|uniref:uncharacterized protein LOC106110096 n=1 Tax=Papilio polytes TaxID=76194 RepID=UPI000675FF52|nr:PREDICTED: uncharacterized protein LOC106110096 [Papilio polytes]
MANTRISAFGLIATVQAIILLFLTIFLILHAYCVIDFVGDTFIAVMIKTLYFHDPGLCGDTINIGTLIDGIADQAFIKMEYAPFTYNRTLYFIWGNFAVAILCLIANELMFINWSIIPWLLVSLVACLLDFSGILIYLNETYATKTLPDVMVYIGAKSFGTGNLALDTASVAPIMSLIISKCVVFLIINCTLLVWHAMDRNDQYNTYVNAIAAAENPISPADFPLETIDVSPQRLPRPSLYRNDRFVATLRLRDIEADCSPAPRELTIAQRQPEPLSRNQRAFSAEDIRIRVPDALLSLPQRLEKIIADESKNLEFRNELRQINEINKIFEEYKVWWLSDYKPERRLDHMRMRTDSFPVFNDTAKAASPSRRNSVDSVLYSKAMRQSVLFTSQDPDVLY